MNTLWLLINSGVFLWLSIKQSNKGWLNTLIKMGYVILLVANIVMLLLEIGFMVVR